MEGFHTHAYTVTAGDVELRPFRAEDWAYVVRWNQDPDVLLWTDGDQVGARTPEETYALYRQVSQTALCFIIERGGNPIGDCWVQRMNAPQLLERFPGQDLRRIDIAIGEKANWGQGIGTRVIHMLTEFAFAEQNADAVFGLVGDHNPRSRRAFEKAGYGVIDRLSESTGAEAQCFWVLRAARPD
jgi:RimJ/RimL family protein N-acetyltransferase